MMKCSAGFFSLVFGAAAALLLLRDGADAYAPMGMTTKRSTMSMKRGRGSFKDEVGGEGGPPSSFSSSSSSSSSGPSSGGMMPSGRNWYTVPNKKINDLPAEEGKVRQRVPARDPLGPSFQLSATFVSHYSLYLPNSGHPCAVTPHRHPHRHRSASSKHRTSCW